MTTCTQINISNTVLVKAVTVSAKTRHKQDRRDVTILIPQTNVDLCHYWTGHHRDFVQRELFKLGLNSCSHFISLTCVDETVLNKDELQSLFMAYHSSKSLTNFIL
ncbi:hypothetical protein [Vibrio scophthalmi]|uniref:Uncharacterized protein n=1 Tax=Vibrio scophthalmi LMG 19158 TaxID=870967 RepID=F9RMY4_9VIBR|nr:hypothetical protein [Vibrio scophthalmi]EGU37780.1 hypothetical protein VIS19158_10099 [Vibrio scophthalmi LMG 19158]